MKNYEIINQDLEHFKIIIEENKQLKQALEILKGRICVYNGYICYDMGADVPLNNNEIQLLNKFLVNYFYYGD